MSERNTPSATGLAPYPRWMERLFCLDAATLGHAAASIHCLAEPFYGTSTLAVPQCSLGETSCKEILCISENQSTPPLEASKILQGCLVKVKKLQLVQFDLPSNHPAVPFRQNVPTTNPLHQSGFLRQYSYSTEQDCNKMASAMACTCDSISLVY